MRKKKQGMATTEYEADQRVPPEAGEWAKPVSGAGICTQRVRCPAQQEVGSKNKSSSLEAEAVSSSLGVHGLPGLRSWGSGQGGEVSGIW